LSTLIFENIVLKDLPGIARWIKKFADNEKIWLFEGEMGAGKTTFIQALCKTMGVTAPVQSPTFSLVNEYITSDNILVYHFDFYRIRTQAEALDIGFEEYLYSGNYCFIEWSSKIPDLLPTQYLKISITLDVQNQRTISASSVY
jgi:tRNA threonylcarbamoyladenosine biosynthesis protein TsaE